MLIQQFIAHLIAHSSPSGTANKSRGEKVTRKYRIVVPWSDFRLVNVRIDAALASAISQRANICTSKAVCLSPEITKLQLSGVWRTCQESRKQLLTSWKIRINRIKFYWLIDSYDAFVHAMLHDAINAASLRCVAYCIEQSWIMLY